MKYSLFIIILCSLSFKAESQQDIKEFRSHIDSLVQNAIDSSAFPGAQVLIKHRDSILLHKAYGHHTYQKKRKTDTLDLYDLASVTKIMAGGLALMKLEQMGLFDPKEKLGETHPYFKNSDKSDITWKEILAHQSGLQPYIVFWQTAKNRKDRFKWRTFSRKYNKWNPIVIDDDIFLHRRYPRKMRKIIRSSPLNSEKKYLYSGLAFLLIPDLIYQRSGLCLDEFLRDQIYHPLHADRITFKPSEYFPLEDIVPTESDTFFRKKTVHGYVHDENASMLDGVSANAGLFANASSLMTICDRLLKPDNEVFMTNIVEKYTSVQFPENDNRRGLAFDKPLLDYDASASYVAESASPSSYGHSGFTGTFIWIDPEHELTVIFLSNRVHPYRSNRKLYSMNFRPKLHQAAYDFIEVQNDKS